MPVLMTQCKCDRCGKLGQGAIGAHYPENWEGLYLNVLARKVQLTAPPLLCDECCLALVGWIFQQPTPEDS